MYKKIINKLSEFADSNFAEWLRPFINVKKDSKEIVLGIRVPILRKLAKEYQNLDIKTLEELLASNIHEAKELALFIMLLKNKKDPKLMCELYLKNLKYIDNWDLIDYTCPHIIAPNCDKKILIDLANADSIWANRIAIVSTIHYIKQNDFKLTLDFAKKFIDHPHHLIHKATGWMLREIGKKDLKTLENFLKKYSEKMPSIMKSYANEVFRKKI